MKIRSLRHDGAVHRVWENAVPALSQNGYLIPTDTPVREGNGRMWSSHYPVIAQFWPRAFFQVFLLLKVDRVDYYCNIITPITRTKTDIWFIDLDYDVLVMDGQVSLVDEDEFQCRKTHYPMEWIAGALAAKAFVLQMARGQYGPFSPAIAIGWRDWLSRKENISK